jgi:phosphatidate cytidylyltransferase
VWWPDSFGALLLNRLGWPGLLLSGVVLAAWSIVGDLFESLLKRRAGVKDSSRLLPGHGGVYDRIDAVLPVAPAAVLLLLL